MKEQQLIKNLTLISVIMIVIHFIGIIYQLFISETITAIIIKLLYILLFTTLIIMLYKKNILATLISIIITIYSIILSTIYFDFLSVLVSLVLLYYSYHFYILLKSNNKIKKSTSKIK